LAALWEVVFVVGCVVGFVVGCVVGVEVVCPIIRKAAAKHSTSVAIIMRFIAIFLLCPSVSRRR
jgi:H+/gluconate symporter-like permease